jgi:hypothetical protein
MVSALHSRATAAHRSNSAKTHSPGACTNCMGSLACAACCSPTLRCHHSTCTGAASEKKCFVVHAERDATMEECRDSTGRCTPSDYCQRVTTVVMVVSPLDEAPILEAAGARNTALHAPQPSPPSKGEVASLDAVDCVQIGFQPA